MLGLYPLGPDTGSELCVHSCCGFLEILVAFSSFLKAMTAPISGLASPSHTVPLCLSSWSSAEVNLQTFIYAMHCLDTSLVQMLAAITIHPAGS